MNKVNMGERKETEFINVDSQMSSANSMGDFMNESDLDEDDNMMNESDNAFDLSF